jgi:rod shape-determining protein MreB and related proteins
MLANLLSSTAYVRVRRNQFQVRDLESGMDATVVSQTPFTTGRLLIGQFLAAQTTLKGALKQLAKGRLLAVSPHVVIHPMEMVDGGLSEIEDRIFREVAIGAGASKVVVWVGHELNDAEVKEKLNAK